MVQAKRKGTYREVLQPAENDLVGRPIMTSM